MNLIVRKKPGFETHRGLISTPLGEFACLLGKSGITTRKREGDGATPSGSFEVLYGYFRKDRTILPQCPLAFEAIRQDDGWCDDPGDRAYNRPVKLPYAASHEKMMRADRLYDICLVLDYNLSPRIRGAGSAIFFHQTNEQQGPTQGCVAVEPGVMRRLLGVIRSGTRMVVLPD